MKVIYGLLAVVAVLSAYLGVKASNESSASPRPLDIPLSELGEYQVPGSAPAPSVAAPANDSSPRRTQPRGRWHSTSWRSEMTDFVNHGLSVDANRAVRDRFGRAATPHLTIRCMEDTTAVYLNAEEFVGTDELRVELRVDQAQATTDSWRISTDRYSFGLWRGRQAIPFVRSLLDADRLAVRYTPYGEGTRTVVFDVTGLSVAIEPLRNACGW